MKHSIVRSLWERIQSAKLQSDIKHGRKQWGRQPGATIAAKIIRADGSVEDLGIIAEGTVSFLPGQGQG